MRAFRNKNLILRLFFFLLIAWVTMAADFLTFNHVWNPQVQAFIHSDLDDGIPVKYETVDAFQIHCTGNQQQVEICFISWVFSHSPAENSESGQSCFEGRIDLESGDSLSLAAYSPLPLERAPKNSPPYRIIAS